MLSRDNVKLATVAVVCLTVGLAAPATAALVKADYAKNADRVDGKHAVSASASKDARKGKLVATKPGNGKLPNNIIAKAPNAAKLGGTPASEFLSGYEVVRSAQVSLDPGEYGSAEVTCPGTKVVLGGGWTTIDGVPNLDVFRSILSTDGRTYSATAQHVAGGNDRRFYAYAICANG